MLTGQCQKDGTAVVDELTEVAKVTRDIADIFIAGPHGYFVKFPQTVLIEGAPRIGKTFLLKEIAYRWANANILTEAKIVLLVYLRDFRFHSVTTIKELIEYFYCLEEDEIFVIRKELRQLNGEGVVFLIHRILSKSVIVITSRPTASLVLHDKVDQRIEILGFGSADCDEYITESLKSSPEKRSELDKYLKLNPLLNALVYIPFHLSVFLFLFQQGYLPKTLTELNKLFILHTIYRHLYRNKDKFHQL